MADRSPCGTGTSAKLAALYAHGQIGMNEPFVYESFIGSKFTGIVKGKQLSGTTKQSSHRLPEVPTLPEQQPM